MIYFFQLSYNYGSIFAAFVHTANAQPASAAVERSETVFVVDPKTVQVVKNDEGPQYFNDDHYTHQMEDGPALQPNATMVIEEEELLRWLDQGCPIYHEWRWQTLREYQPRKGHSNT